MYLVKELRHYCNISVAKYERIHPAVISFYDFTFVTEGSMRYIVNGTEYVLGPNDAIFLPPGTLRARPKENTPVKYVSFNFLPLEGVRFPFPLYMKNVISKDLVKLASVFPKRHCFEYDHSKEKLAAILNYMLYELLELVDYGTNDSYVLKALRFIDAHILEKISLSSVSEHLNISKEYLSTLFKSKTGKTVTVCIQERKMQLAKEKIKYTDTPLGRIAVELGFENYNYFSRIFRRYFEISPAKYRANFKETKQP